MKNFYGLSSKPSVKSPSHQGYLGYVTQKQLQQLNKYKKEQESDKDSFVSGHSNKGRRMKLRHVEWKFIWKEQLGAVLTFKMENFLHIEERNVVIGVSKRLKSWWREWILIIRTWFMYIKNPFDDHKKLETFLRRKTFSVFKLNHKTISLNETLKKSVEEFVQSITRLTSKCFLKLSFKCCCSFSKLRKLNCWWLEEAPNGNCQSGVKIDFKLSVERFQSSKRNVGQSCAKFLFPKSLPCDRQ